MKKKVITLIGVNFYPEDTAIGLYSTQMVRYFAEKGHTINVITGFPYYPQWSIREEYRSKPKYLQEKMNEINILRYKQYVPIRPSFLKRVIHLLDFTYGSYFNIRKIKQTDITQLNKDNVLTVSNTGKSESGLHQPSLVSIDLDTEKLIERIKLENDGLYQNSLNCGHFKITDDNDLIIASAPVASQSTGLSGGISIRRQNESITTMTEPDVVIKSMTGEALSIEINQQQTIAAITHPLQPR